MKKIYFAALIACAGLAQAQGPPGHMGGHGGMRFMGFEGGHPGQVVTGAPFSAKEVTQDTQTLANGSHIQNNITAQFYRDAQGRTRIERTFSGIGPWGGGTPHTMITIFDPVAGFLFELNPAKQTAVKLPLPAPHTGAKTPHQSLAGETAVKTDLGTQIIQGLACTGTRNTITIAAGQIGNDQPIVITEDRWYSPDLQMVVQSKRVDPRSGEVDFNLQDVARSAPEASLFMPPGSYTITVRTAGDMHRGPGMQ